MPQNDRHSITSEDYADLIINYEGNVATFDNYPPGFINYIDQHFAILHIPVEFMTVNAISKFGYSTIPFVFGLETDNNLDSSRVLTRRYNHNGLTGKDVLIGIVDTGIDYLNPLFIRPNNTTKIMSIWDQSIDSDSDYPENFYFGTEFSMEQINAAIASPDPYSVVPSTDTIGHGTKLAAISGGLDIDSENFSGVAPDADFVIVKLKPAKKNLKDFFYIPEDAIGYGENDIMIGVRYLFEYSQKVRRPIVICLGIGSSQGEHTGNSFLAALLSDYSTPFGTCICVPAGNEANRGHHYYADIDPKIGSDMVDLNVDSNNKGFTMELYVLPPSEIWLEIYPPTGGLLSRISPSVGIQKTVEIFYNNTSIIIDTQVREGIASTRQLSVFRIKNPEPGIWRFAIYTAYDLPSSFHMWLPIAPFISPNTFFMNPNNNTTITSPGNTRRIITATAYDTENHTLFFYASRGNTANEEPKPDITAPGVNIRIPEPDGSISTNTGTSFSTAFVTGAAALLLEWGVIRGNNTTLNTAGIKWILTISARRVEGFEYPNPDWGFGTLSIPNILEMLRLNTFGGEILPP